MSIKGVCLIHYLTLVTHSHWPQRPKLIWNAQHHRYFTHAHHSIIEETSKQCNTAICITLKVIHATGLRVDLTAHSITNVIIHTV